MPAPRPMAISACRPRRMAASPGSGSISSPSCTPPSPESPVTTPAASAGQGGVFGRRKGHPLRAAQAALFDSRLPRLAIDLSSPAPADLRTLFDSPVEAVRLEIGFGGAEH